MLVFSVLLSVVIGLLLVFDVFLLVSIVVLSVLVLS